MTPFRLFYLLLMFNLLSASSLHAEETSAIRYPRLSLGADPNGKYLMELLSEALTQSKQHYQLIPSNNPMQQARAIYEMTSGNGTIDVIWTTTTDEREKLLIPVRIPLDKGLFGWRIAMVAHEGLLNHINSISDLRKFTAGQEFDWPDTDVLRKNGLPVVTSTSYAPLFTMLRVGRFDYFPRSVVEIQNEFETHIQAGLFIDKSIVLHYPAAFYFFVTPRKPDVAKAIQQGLEKMLKNGRFDKLFQQYLGPAIQKANLRQRTVIELNNPLLKPEALPLNRSELWYRP